MTNRGMSTSAIATAVGYGQSTIDRDVKALTQLGRVAPDRVTVGVNDQEYPQGRDRAEQTVQLVQDQKPKTPIWRLQCEIGNERIDKKLKRIHELLDQLDWEGDVTEVFARHLAEIAQHAAELESHYNSHGGRVAPHDHEGICGYLV
jgi:arginyl-tRNA synthetase